MFILVTLDQATDGMDSAGQAAADAADAGDNKKAFAESIKQARKKAAAQQLIENVKAGFEILKGIRGILGAA